MSRRAYSGPSRGPAQPIDVILPGCYRTRLVRNGPWQPVLVRVEHSRDDEGRQADRPRLVLYLGRERHERPRVERRAGTGWPGQDTRRRITA